MKSSLKWWRCCKTENESDKVRSYTNKTSLLGQTIGAVEMASIFLFSLLLISKKKRKMMRFWLWYGWWWFSECVLDESKCFGAVFGWWVKSYGILVSLVCECVFGVQNVLESNLFCWDTSGLFIPAFWSQIGGVFGHFSRGDNVVSMVAIGWL